FDLEAAEVANGFFIDHLLQGNRDNEAAGRSGQLENAAFLQSFLHVEPEGLVLSGVTEVPESTAAATLEQPLRTNAGDRDRIRRPAEYGDLPKRCCQVAIIVNEHVRQATYCQVQILQRARKPREQFVVGNVVAPLRYAHGDALARLFGACQPDVPQ